jgi:hypothetical protein
MSKVIKESVAKQCRVQVLEECSKQMHNGCQLCLQWARYIYDNGNMELGYRFIWRRPDGSLQAARGQARIPSFADMQELMAKAKKGGWARNEG